KANNMVDMTVLEHAAREYLNIHTPRVMAVLDPLKVVIENYPKGQEEVFDVAYFKQDKTREESRPLPFSREIYIERDDFMEIPVKGYNRLAPGAEVRLMNAYYIVCTGVVKDSSGRIVELRATYDPATRGGTSSDGRKVKGTIHWVSAEHAIPAEVRLYEPLFTRPDPEEGVSDFIENLNPNSLVVVDALVEPSLATAQPGDKFQFVRDGYFCVDPDTEPDRLVFNRTVSL